MLDIFKNGLIIPLTTLFLPNIILPGPDMTYVNINAVVHV